jgi:hypothetical protein
MPPVADQRIGRATVLTYAKKGEIREVARTPITQPPGLLEKAMPTFINLSGEAPGKDGDIHVFISGEVGSQPWFNKGQKAIFVNGMDNDGKEHRKSALTLSTMLGCPVTGVFNITAGTWVDLGQCITDKWSFDAALNLGRPLFSFDDWKLAVDRGHTAAQKKQATLTRIAYVRKLIAGNAATAALYDLLLEPGYTHPSVPIFAHSQGNLITSNALTALALAKGHMANEGRVVNSYGSPCRFWPPRLSRVNNAFSLDPVGWLDLRFQWNSSNVGFKVAHSFLTYMENDPEFVINRFRVGGVGMTFNMDEQGLGNALAGMGSNVERIFKVFKRLADKNGSDADDVAVYFMRKLQNPAGQQLLRKFVTVKPGLIDLLITVLDEGWTTAEEQKFIDQLKALS